MSLDGTVVVQGVEASPVRPAKQQAVGPGLLAIGGDVSDGG